MQTKDFFSRPYPTFSLEVFPPKTKSSVETIYTTLSGLKGLPVDFISVTYGAGGSDTQKNKTCEIASLIKREYGIEPVAHLTCVSSTRELVRERIGQMKAAGIENVMALRGDLTPELEGADRSQWPYRHAIDLIRELKESGAGFCIGGACYPEVHPESENQREDILHLKEKVDAGCEFLTTQMFFDNNLLYNFLYKIREAGITVPVLPGIMPITKANQVERAIQLSGSFMPQRFKSLVDKFGHSPDAMKQAGIAYATDQIIDLYANGIRTVHVYTMNNPDVAAKILDNLSHILG